MKSLSRQSLKLDKKQFAVLQSVLDRNQFLVLKPKHATRRNQAFNTLNSADSKGNVTNCDTNDASASIKQNFFWIGRISSCDLILDDAMVSSKHLKVVCFSQKDGDNVNVWYEVSDNSTNGTLLNGKRMEKKVFVKLREHDVIKFPSASQNDRFVFKFCLPEHPKLTQNLDLFVGTGKKTEIEEKIEEKKPHENFNSLNLQIINDTQRKFQKRNLNSFSLKSHKSHFDNIDKESSLELRKKTEKYQKDVTKHISSITSKAQIANKMVQDLLDERQMKEKKVQTMIDLHQQERSALIDFMQNLVHDVQNGGNIENWAPKVNQIKDRFS